MDFPQYRKRFDSKSFYKITSLTSFEEVQLIGKRFYIYSIKAEKYFEQLQVMDMLEAEVEMYNKCDAKEFQEHFDAAMKYLG